MTVPSAFDTCATATSRVAGPRSLTNSSTINSPRSSIGASASGRPFRTQHLPGDNVRMVFERGDQHFVAWTNARPAESLGDQVDSLSGAADKDDLARLGGAEKPLQLDACRFVIPRRPLAEQMNGAMDVGTFLDVEVIQRVQDGARLLRSGGVVEINKRSAMDRLRERRKVLADSVHVEGVGAVGCRASRDRRGRHRAFSGSVRRPGERAESCASNAHAMHQPGFAERSRSRMRM